MTTLLNEVPFIPSGLATKLGFIEKTTSLSSSIVGILVSWVFWSVLIIIGMQPKVCSLIWLSSPMKIVLKCSQAAWAILSSPCIQSPFLLIILWINSFLLLPLIMEWKYLELVSPSLNYWSWVFSFKILSSNLRNLHIEHWVHGGHSYLSYFGQGCIFLKLRALVTHTS